MSAKEIQNLARCPTADISAYLDGELPPQVELDLEIHIASCTECTRELNEQKSLLLAIDSTLDEPEIDLPTNFSKAVVARAESGVNGLRRPKERLNAALVSAALLLFSIVVLGNATGRSFAVFLSVFQGFLAVASAAGHFVYDLSLGTSVIFRTLFSTFVAASPSAALLYAAIFFAALFAFSKLFFRQSGA